MVAAFDGNGDFVISAPVPAGLAPLTLSFQVFGQLPSGAVGASNIQDLRFSDLYAGMGRSSPTAPGSVAILDVTNNFNGATLGTPVVGGISGLTFDGADRLWASARDAGFTETSLVEIDPDTGAAISSTPMMSGSDTLRIADLATQPRTGIVYGVGLRSSGTGFGEIFTIDTATAEATFIGNPGLGSDGGLAFTPDGRLYMCSASVGNPFIAEISPVDGSLISVVALGPDVGLGGLEAHPVTGQLLATRGQFAGGDLIVEIDPVTGNTTPLGMTLVGSPSDLAFR